MHGVPARYDVPGSESNTNGRGTRKVAGQRWRRGARATAACFMAVLKTRKVPHLLVKGTLIYDDSEQSRR